MAQVSRMTAQEAQRYVEKNNATLQVAYEATAEFEAGEPGKFIGRGFTAFKEYINENGQRSKAVLRMPLNKGVSRSALSKVAVL